MTQRGALKIRFNIDRNSKNRLKWNGIKQDN